MKTKCDWNRINLETFVDRDFLVRRVISGLGSYESFCILGGRKSGKTALLQKLEREMAAPLLPVFLDFQMAPPEAGIDWVYAAICSVIGGGPAWSGDFVSSMTDLIRLMATKGARLVLLTDEAEALERFSWAGTFFDNLNHLLFNNQTTARNLALVIAGGVYLEASPKLGPCSPLLIRLTPLGLGLLNQAEVREFCKRVSDNALPEGDIAEIFTKTAGHPALLQYFLSKLEAIGWKGPLGPIAESIAADGISLCEVLFRSLSRADAEIYVALGGNGLIAPQSPAKIREYRSTLRRLQFLGLVGRGQDSVSRNGPTLFRQWYSQSGDHAELNPLVELQANREEDEYFELKSTLAFDLWKFTAKSEKARNADVAAEVPQAVVAFLNADGGTIVIGIADPKDDRQRQSLSGYPMVGKRPVLGIEWDFELLKGGWDEFVGALLSHLKEKVDVAVAQQLRIESIVCEKKVLAVVRVPRGLKYYYYDRKFILRIKNRSQLLTTEEAVEFIRDNPR